MDIVAFDRAGLLAFTAVFALAAVLLPTLRMRRRTGHSGYVANRTPTPVHRVAVEGLRLLTLGCVTWNVLYALLGPARLGVWSLPRGAIWAGWLLVAAGLVVVVIAQVQMGASWRIGIDNHQRTELVTTGLFRWVRNPIFSGLLITTLGMVAVTPSPWTLMGWLFLVFVLALQVRLEEEHLLRLHGAAYAAYASQVGRFVPGLAPNV